LENAPISSLVAATFASAIRKHSDLPAVWVRISFRLGGLLPKSMLPASIQQDGNLDVLLRSLEDEYATVAPSALTGEAGLFVFNYQVMLSEIWVGRFYEHLRLLIERGLLKKTGAAAGLANDFRLLRIPIEKHEIMADWSLAGPLQMQRVPVQGNPSDLYVYDKNDLQRAHIMPRSVSNRGSLMWQVIDLKNKTKERWIERRGLSDRIIELWGTDTSAAKSA
jgi:hypothetical protein